MGGHAFMQKGERGTVEDHERNARRIASVLMSLVEREYRLVITHGNAPQVGNLLIQTETARELVPEMPLDVLVAMTEGSLGYILQQALLNELRARKVRRYVVTVVTQVLVDEADPAFHTPTKPIGPALGREQAHERRDRLGWQIREDPGRGWRRLVASPRPLRVVQNRMVRDAALAGHIVVACGGGGIPIKKDPSGDYTGVEAVIDKDLTSALLASQVGADLFVILTGVDRVCLDYATPRERPLDRLTAADARLYLDEGQFPEGSMGPKIQAVLQFLEAGGREALITDAAHLVRAVEGRAGTRLLPATLALPPA
jgi:carbamate kinase